MDFHGRFLWLQCGCKNDNIILIIFTPQKGQKIFPSSFDTICWFTYIVLCHQRVNELCYRWVRLINNTLLYSRIQCLLIKTEKTTHGNFFSSFTANFLATSQKRQPAGRFGSSASIEFCCTCFVVPKSTFL